MLKIKKGGRLEETEWVYDEEAEKGSYVTTDITSLAPLNLFSACELDDDIRLRDIFLLLNSELDLFDSILGNYTRELVKEGLTPISEDEDEIEQLELCWNLERAIADGKETLIGNIFPDFHGLGREAKEELVGYSVALCPANTIANLPLKLNSQYVIINKEDDYQAPFVLSGPSFSLQHILYGIVWELSFFGAPQERTEACSDIKTSYEDILDNFNEEGDPND